MPEKIYASEAEAKLDNALQLLACLLDMLGGEAVISRRDFTMLEDVAVTARNLGSHIILKLDFEDECDDVDVAT